MTERIKTNGIIDLDLTIALPLSSKIPAVLCGKEFIVLANEKMRVSHADAED